MACHAIAKRKRHSTYIWGENRKEAFAEKVIDFLVSFFFRFTFCSFIIRGEWIMEYFFVDVVVVTFIVYLVIQCFRIWRAKWITPQSQTCSNYFVAATFYTRLANGIFARNIRYAPFCSCFFSANRLRKKLKTSKRVKSNEYRRQFTSHLALYIYCLDLEWKKYTFGLRLPRRKCYNDNNCINQVASVRRKRMLLRFWVSILVLSANNVHFQRAT